MQKKVKWTCYTFIVAGLITLNIPGFWHDLWLRYQLRNEHIVVSFTTTPHRIFQMRDTIETIFNQKIAPKKIYLSLPYVFKRDNIPYVIPEWLAKDKRITILRTEDYGPATKLLGALEKADLPDNAIIITVDDDVFYPKNLVQELAYKAKLLPNSAIGILGSNPDYGPDGVIKADSYEGTINVDMPDDYPSILQGFSGIAYRRSFFKNDIFDIVNAPKECRNSDDLYLSFYLAKNNIPRRIHANRYIDTMSIDWKNPIGLQDDALHNLIPKPADKHRTCVAYMHSKDPNVIF